ncbi:MAG: type II toxin-antitoxin system RelE/ParE family toxin [Methylohalobius sp. ZOD2]
MHEIRKRASAEEDLIGIWSYTFAQWGPQQADAYLDRLAQEIAIIAENPLIGVNCDSIRLGYRRFQVKHHMVYYRVQPGQIEIVRVLHKEMEPDRHL